MSLFDAILSLINPEVDTEFDILRKHCFKGLASWCQEAHIDLNKPLSYKEKKRVYEHKEAIRTRHKTIVTEENFNAQVMRNERRARYYADYLLSLGKSPDDKEYVLSCVRALDDYIFQRIENEYNRLKEKYPKGVEGYENACNPKPSKEAVIALGEAKLSELEQRGIEVERGEQWMKEQNEYARFCRDLRDQMFPEWGCYYYDIPATIPSFADVETPVSYRVWQLFYNSYCDAPDLDYSLYPSLQKNYEKIPDLECDKTHFPSFAYDQIVQGILAIKEKYRDCTVIISDSPSCFDYQELDDSHYNLNFHTFYLAHQLEKHGIKYEPHPICIARLNDDGNGKPICNYVVVVESITSNQYLKKLSKAIISSPNCNYPHIFYISLMKGYDRDEAEKIILDKKQQIEKEEQERIQHQKDIEYLKACVESWERPGYSIIKCFSMYYYYPTNCDFGWNNHVWDIRNLIWDFKANPPAHNPKPIEEVIALHKKAVERIAEDMNTCLRLIFGDKVSKLTLACIPASTQEITQRRYEDFADELCKLTGMTNGYPYIRVAEDGEAKHTGGTQEAKYDIDKEFFKGKCVLLFDDVITQGKSMGKFGGWLKIHGAEVIGGFSIGITKHELQPSDPIDLLIKNKQA